MGVETVPQVQEIQTAAASRSKHDVVMSQKPVAFACCMSVLACIEDMVVQLLLKSCCDVVLCVKSFVARPSNLLAHLHLAATSIMLTLSLFPRALAQYRQCAMLTHVF